ncbi:MAG: hypothetical protein U0W40_18825 [Acidimicrobiia bacterium]
MNTDSSTRRLPLILVAGVLVLCLVGVVLAGIDAGSGFGAVAYTVGDTKVSQQTVNDDLKALAEQKTFASTFLSQSFQTTDGAVDSAAAAGWLTYEIYRTVGTQALAKQGKKITDQQRQAAVDEQVTQSGPSFRAAFKDLPADVRNRLYDLLVVGQRVKALKQAHITVDPKYGFWNAKRQIVCPPTGCPAPAASASSSG